MNRWFKVKPCPIYVYSTVHYCILQYNSRKTVHTEFSHNIIYNIRIKKTCPTSLFSVVTIFKSSVSTAVGRMVEISRLLSSLDWMLIMGVNSSSCSSGRDLTGWRLVGSDLTSWTMETVVVFGGAENYNQILLCWTNKYRGKCANTRHFANMTTDGAWA